MNAAMQWIRRHPFRVALYVSLAVTALAAVLLFRQIVEGKRDALLHRLADSSLVRDWMRTRLEVGYQFHSLHFGRDSQCWMRVHFNRAAVAVGLARASSDAVDVCVLTAEPLAVHLHVAEAMAGNSAQPALVEARRIDASVPRGDASLLAAKVRSESGVSLLHTGEVQVRWTDRLVRSRQLELLPDSEGALLTLRDSVTRGIDWQGARLNLELSHNQGALVRAVEQSPGVWSWIALAPQARAAMTTARGLAADLRALVQRAIGNVSRDLGFAAILASCVIVVWKLLVTRTPGSWLVRIALSLAPVLWCWILRGSWRVALLTSAAMALILWLSFYRRSKEWHQRWEPVVADLVAPLLIVTPLLAQGALSRVRIPDLADLPKEVHLTKGNLQDLRVYGQTASCGKAGAATVVMPAAQVEEVTATLDLAAMQLVDLNWKTAQAEGVVESALLQGTGTIRYLPAEWRHLQPPAFCAVITPMGTSPASAACRAPRSALSVALGAAVDWKQLQADFHARLQAPALHVELSGRGSANAATIETLRSLPGSDIRVQRGSGEVRLQPNRVNSDFRLERIAAGVNGGSIAVGKAALATATPMVCQAGPVDVQGTLQRIAWSNATAHTRTDEASIVLLRPAPNTMSFDAKLLRSTVQGGGAEIEVPAATVGWRGRTSTQTIPRTVDGLLHFRAQHRDGEQAAGLSAPLRFHADLWRGTVQVPPQQLRLEQSVYDGIDRSIPLQLSASASLQALTPRLLAAAEATVAIARLAPQADPLEVELRGVGGRFRWATDRGAAWEAGGSVAMRLPASPPGLELSSIPRLELGSRGSVRALPPADPLSADVDAIRDFARRHLPGNGGPLEVDFVASAADPPDARLRLTTRSGAAVEGLLRSRLESLHLPDLRFQSASVETALSHLKTDAFGGDLSVKLHSKADRNRLELLVRAPVEASISVLPAKSIIRLTKPAPLHSLIEQAKPFLRQAQLPVDGWDIRGKLNGFHAELTFRNKELTGYRGELSLAGGSVLQVDLDRLLAPAQPRFLRHVDVTLGEPFSIQLDAAAGRYPQAEAALRGSAVDVSLNRDAQRAIWNLETLLELKPAGTMAPSAFREKLAAAGSALRQHANHAYDVFGDSTTLSSLQWDMELQTPSQPFLSLASDQAALRFDSHWKQLAAAFTNGPAPVHAGGWIGVHASLALHQGHLVAQVDAPADLWYARNDGSRLRWKDDLAVLAAFTEKLRPATTLRPATATAADLWDTDFYQKFWDSYSPAQPKAAPLFQRAALAIGGVSVSELRFPTSPLRFAVGFQDSLQLHYPFTASALFGDAEGLLQSRLSWLGRTAMLDSAGKFTVCNFQAGGFQVLSHSGPSPLVEDSLDAVLEFETKALPLSRDTLANLRGDPSRILELDRFSFNGELRSARDGRTQQGMLLVQSDISIDFRDEVLNELSRVVQRLTPRGEPLRYREMVARLKVRQGVVDRLTPLLVLNGVESRAAPPASGDIRIHWGRTPGFAEQPIRLRNLVSFFQRLYPSRPLP